MKNASVLFAAICAAAAAQGQFLSDLAQPVAEKGQLKFTSDQLSASRRDGSFSVTGHVAAVQPPYRFWSNRLSKSPEGLYDLGEEILLTTCSNDVHHLHWNIQGKSPFPSLVPDGNVTYVDHRTDDPTTPWYLAFRNEKGVKIENAWLCLSDVPVLWIPYWYYPLDTDYGWRFLPGYCSRWGGYLLGGYVYNLVNEGLPDRYSLGGSTYADFRTENGLAVGQTFRWGLKDFGKGKIRFWYGWDEDYDRYANHWSDHQRNWRNWSSKVDRERYRIHFEHEADFTERDSLRLHGDFLSDSQVLSDFFNRGPYHTETHPVNELWYEHRENSWALGGSVSGPINDYYNTTARLPEGWFMVEPQPLWTSPVNYESETRVGYLNRTPGETGSSDPIFPYRPSLGETGRGADYQAVRADTYHRISLPTKFADALSFVPRASYRATHWTDSGDRLTGYETAADNALTRHVAEFGFQLSARAQGWLNDDWRHVFEPYLDYSLQEASFSSGDKYRHYVFDAYDRSTEWLDEFGFEGRGLPFSWHGIRPGVRNFFQKRDDSGVLRTVLDTDLYAAIPFCDESYRSGSYAENGALRGYARDPEVGNYSRHDCVVPGVRLRWRPDNKTTFGARVEYDCDNEKFAYADVSLRRRETDSFSWYVSYTGRDHRLWDYLSVPERQLDNGNADRYNWELDNLLSVGFEHTVCDWFAWSPFVRYDCRRAEAEEVGAWFDFLTDCLGYRFEASYSDGYRRIDGSRDEDDVRVCFFIYLRALGPGSMLDLMRF